MTKSGKSDPNAGRDQSSDPVLRAKYLDYCSARVADLLLRLTADEMYLLAQDAAQELGLDNDETLSYSTIVRLATDRMSRKLDLPDFPAWVQAYREDPERFEQELLGLWEAELRTSGRNAH